MKLQEHTLGEARRLVLQLRLRFYLLLATTLAVYKPRGVTPYGQRKEREQRAALTT